MKFTKNTKYVMGKLWRYFPIMLNFSILPQGKFNLIVFASQACFVTKWWRKKQLNDYLAFKKNPDGCIYECHSHLIRWGQLLLLSLSKKIICTQSWPFFIEADPEVFVLIHIVLIGSCDKTGSMEESDRWGEDQGGCLNDSQVGVLDLEWFTTVSVNPKAHHR